MQVDAKRPLLIAKCDKLKIQNNHQQGGVRMNQNKQYF